VSIQIEARADATQLRQEEAKAAAESRQALREEQDAKAEASNEGSDDAEDFDGSDQTDSLQAQREAENQADEAARAQRQEERRAEDAARVQRQDERQREETIRVQRQEALNAAFATPRTEPTEDDTEDREAFQFPQILGSIPNPDVEDPREVSFQLQKAFKKRIENEFVTPRLGERFSEFA
jgi:hypothetical protein